MERQAVPNPFDLRPNPSKPKEVRAFKLYQTQRALKPFDGLPNIVSDAEMPCLFPNLIFFLV